MDAIIVSHNSRHKRYRATALVTQNGKILLVRDKGAHRFSMPGGGFKHGESTIQAGVRELHEEVGGLTTKAVERLRQCDFDGERAKHKVCHIEVHGQPHVRQPHEIDKVIWWDGKSNLPIQGHVRYILKHYVVR